MSRRRVFRTRAQRPGVDTDLGSHDNRRQMIGRPVDLLRSSPSGVNVSLNGTVVGELDASVATQVASAIDRGQSFTATIEKAYPHYINGLNQAGAQLDIKVEYLLENGQPAIEAPRSWRAVEMPPEMLRQSRSFFTKVAGVTFEGRQRIISRCSKGDELILLRDPNDRFDKGAIRVLRLYGQQLGFVPADVSRCGDPSGLASQMDRGSEYSCRIANLTGRGARAKHWSQHRDHREAC